MDIIFQNQYSKPAPCVATLGFFDGVHAGHQYLLSQLIQHANMQQLPSVVFTFNQHPLRILQPQLRPKLLSTFEERLKLIEQCGVDQCVILDFNEQMASLTAAEFIQSILLNQFKVSALLIGHNHKFGSNRLESFVDYQRYGNQFGIKVIKADKFDTQLNSNICSTNIRHAIESGDITLANSMLSRPYSLDGKVIGGFKIGRTIGFPTANLEINGSDKLIPAIGTYAVYVNLEKERHLGMLNIGTRPTLNNGTNLSIEVHIINFEGDIYEQTIGLELIIKIRDEQKFNDLESLQQQLEKDKDFTISNLKL